MTQKQMIELIQTHHPDMGVTEARLYLNKALKEFCRETKILSGSTTFSTVADQRYYDLDSTVLEITRVDVDDYRIDRLVGLPEKSDVS
jgi:hypothetical protein